MQVCHNLKKKTLVMMQHRSQLRLEKNHSGQFTPTGRPVNPGAKLAVEMVFETLAQMH